MPTSSQKILTGKSRQDILTFFAEEDYRDSLGHPLHMRIEFMELVDMALSGASRVAAIQEDVRVIREMLEARSRSRESLTREFQATMLDVLSHASPEAAQKVSRDLGENCSQRGADDLFPSILYQINRAVEKLGADPDLLAAIGSWRDTMDDQETLGSLCLYNETGSIFKHISCCSRAGSECASCRKRSVCSQAEAGESAAP